MGFIYISIANNISVFMKGWYRVNSISHFLLVLKLPPPLVDHLVALLSVFFQCLTNLLLTNVATHPESNKTLSFCFSPAWSGHLFVINAIVTVDNSLTLVLFFGRNNSAVEARHSIVSCVGLLPLNLLTLILLSCSTGLVQISALVMEISSSSSKDNTSLSESNMS
jgi:hypothetical protein